MTKKLIGRVKFNGDRATILGCVSKKYHKQLHLLAKKMSKEQGKTISTSYLIRIALEAMFPPENSQNIVEDKNQLEMFPELEKERAAKKKREKRVSAA